MTELRRDVLLPFVVLMAVLTVVSAGSVALLARMAPAIERIVAENLYSLQAAEEMMVAICRGGGDESERFVTALARARSNVTEKSERAHLQVLDEIGLAAVAGDPDAKHRALLSLAKLAGINRDAAAREDERAKRLGFAGAWGVVFLSGFSFVWVLMAVSRARRRLIEPLHEMANVLDAAHRGDSYRRCQAMAAPAEVKRVMSGIDELLDARALRAFAQQPPLRAAVDRQVLLFFLEQRPGPAWVLTGNGSVDAANRAGLAVLAGERAESLRVAFAAAVAGEAPAELRISPIADVDRFLCELV
jgi:hypothetical protein